MSHSLTTDHTLSRSISVTREAQRHREWSSIFGRYFSCVNMYLFFVWVPRNSSREYPSLSMQNMIIKLLRLSSFFIFILHQYSKYHLAFHKSSYPCHKNNFFSFPEDAYIPTINLTFRLTSINAHTREQIGKSSSDLPPVCVCVCAPVHSLLPQNVLPSRWLEPFLPIFSGKLLGYLFRSNKEGRKALGSRAVNSSAFINSRCIIINRHFEA